MYATVTRTVMGHACTRETKRVRECMSGMLGCLTWPFNPRLLSLFIYSPCKWKDEQRKRENGGCWYVAEMFEPQSLCAWERRKSITMETPIMQSLVFFLTPFHFAVLLSPFSLFYSYHFHQFPFSFRLPLNPSSHHIFPIHVCYVSVHHFVSLSSWWSHIKPSVRRRAIYHFWEKPWLPLYSWGETVLPPPTFVVMTTTPLSLPSHFPNGYFSDSPIYLFILLIFLLNIRIWMFHCPRVCVSVLA